jgi:hypothetical protein
MNSYQILIQKLNVKGPNGRIRSRLGIILKWILKK